MNLPLRLLSATVIIVIYACVLAGTRTNAISPTHALTLGTVLLLAAIVVIVARPDTAGHRYSGRHGAAPYRSVPLWARVLAAVFVACGALVATGLALRIVSTGWAFVTAMGVVASVSASFIVLLFAYVAATGRTPSGKIGWRSLLRAFRASE